MCVCSGNRFRSPLAEALLRRRLERLPAAVSSYGTLDLRPGPAFEQAVRLGAAYGVDLSAHRSRPLAGADLGDADLVLGFERIHAATAVVEAGAPRDRTFVLPELAAYLPLTRVEPGLPPVAAAREALRQAAELRRTQPHQALDIPDPAGGPERGYEEAASRIAELVAIVADGLAPA